MMSQDFNLMEAVVEGYWGYLEVGAEALTVALGAYQPVADRVEVVADAT
jgi:hypothetical protein